MPTEDRLEEEWLPCGHHAECFERTSQMRYNTPPRPEDGVLRIVPVECSICGMAIREFYSGEHGGPFLGREEFHPDTDEDDDVDPDLERRPNARVIDPREDDDHDCD